MKNDVHITLMLTLLNLKGIGRKKAIKHFREFRERITTLESFSILIDNGWERPLIEEAYLNAKKTLNDCISNEIGIVIVDTEAYPECLYRLKDYPAILFCKGNLHLLSSEKMVAVIGTRTPTKDSQEMGRKTVEFLCQKDFLVVSGLAKGIDEIAHNETLNNKGKTVAVLPSGILNISPKSNKLLANQIIDLDGLLVSEYEPLLGANKYTYVQRDRLQAGFSSAVFVLQTKIDGGTMHASLKAVEMGIPLFVFSSELNDERFSGNARLIKEKNALPFDNINEIDFSKIKDEMQEQKHEQLRFL